MFFQSFLMVIAEEHLAITIRATRACPAAALLIDRIRPHNTQNILIFKKFYLFIFGCTGSLLLRIVVVKVAQSCSILCDPMDYTVHGILQARILEWVAFPFSRGCSQPRDRTQAFHIAGGFFTSWATREDKKYWSGWTITSPADFPDPGIELESPELQPDSLPTELSEKPHSLFWQQLIDWCLRMFPWGYELWDYWKRWIIQ